MNGDRQNLVAPSGDGAGGTAHISVEVLVEHALYGEAFAARMYGDNPDLSPDAVQAYRWAESQFARIARREVDERDLIS